MSNLVDGIFIILIVCGVRWVAQYLRSPKHIQGILQCRCNVMDPIVVRCGDGNPYQIELSWLHSGRARFSSYCAGYSGKWERAHEVQQYGLRTNGANGKSALELMLWVVPISFGMATLIKPSLARIWWRCFLPDVVCYLLASVRDTSKLNNSEVKVAALKIHLHA